MTYKEIKESSRDLIDKLEEIEDNTIGEAFVISFEEEGVKSIGTSLLDLLYEYIDKPKMLLVIEDTLMAVTGYDFNGFIEHLNETEQEEER